MQFLAILTFAAAASAAALEGSRKTARLEARAAELCPPLDSPECCQLDVDGVADLSCEAPSGSPKTLSAFKSACGTEGRSAMCCTVVIVSFCDLLQLAKGDLMLMYLACRAPTRYFARMLRCAVSPTWSAGDG